MSKQEIGFDDIRAGDEIEFGWAAGDTNVTIRGVAASKSASPSWRTPAGRLLVGREDAKDGILLLINRPLPRKVGTTFKVTEINGEPFYATALVAEEAGSIRYFMTTPHNGSFGIAATKITAWEPIEVSA